MHALAVDSNSMLNNGPWLLSDLKDVKPNGLKVFSVFSCGGGSTMGYKLAGYEVVGCCEIDPKMLAVYKANHNPRLPYLMGVKQFNQLSDLPAELFDLDILDGSPPCSSFSVSGSREKQWSEKKKFREGQQEQVLDDLFFDFIETANKLRPKVIVAENVAGLIMANARGYVKEIFKAFKDAGYEAQLFLLNAAAMGVPQKRKRVFFIANRLNQKISLAFNEPQVSVKKAWESLPKQSGKPLSERSTALWHRLLPGQKESVLLNGSCFNSVKLPYLAPSYTVTASDGLRHPIEPRHLSTAEFLRLQTFPDDYALNGTAAGYLCGMSVPPYMMQRVADQIYAQLLA